MRESKSRLLKLNQEFEEMHLEGDFKIFAYEQLPYYHAVCVDRDRPLGKMFISHYMYGIERAETPGMAFSKFARKDLFNKYLTSIEHLLDNTVAIT